MFHCQPPHRTPASGCPASDLEWGRCTATGDCPGSVRSRVSKISSPPFSAATAREHTGGRCTRPTMFVGTSVCLVPGAEKRQTAGEYERAQRRPGKPNQRKGMNIGVRQQRLGIPKKTPNRQQPSGKHGTSFVVEHCPGAHIGVGSLSDRPQCNTRRRRNVSAFDCYGETVQVLAIPVAMGRMAQLAAPLNHVVELKARRGVEGMSSNEKLKMGGFCSRSLSVLRGDDRGPIHHTALQSSLSPVGERISFKKRRSTYLGLAPRAPVFNEVAVLQDDVPYSGPSAVQAGSLCDIPLRVLETCLGCNHHGTSWHKQMKERCRR
jgi:hypothetical protein